MIHTVRIVAGTAGGVGTSTVAAVLAHQDATSTNTDAHLIGGPDLAAVVGARAPYNDAAPDVEQMAEGLYVTTYTRRPNQIDAYKAWNNAASLPEPVTLTIDAGTDPRRLYSEMAARVESERITVVGVTANAYPALRAAIGWPSHLDPRWVCRVEAGRALDASDVANVLNAEPVVIPYDLAIARAVDAGLLFCRRPAPLTRLARSFEPSPA